LEPLDTAYLVVDVRVTADPGHDHQGEQRPERDEHDAPGVSLSPAMLGRVISGVPGGMTGAISVFRLMRIEHYFPLDWAPVPGP
jgi:hypothetical protein